MRRRRPRQTRSLGQRLDSWLTRTLVLGPPRRMAPPPSPMPVEPTTDGGRPVAVRVVVHALAVALLVGVAASLIPLRETITTSTATLVLVLPVVLVAIVGSVSAGAVAAVAAAFAFDVLLTQPYYRFTIDAAADVESAVVLGVIALVVSSLVAREVESRTRSASRLREIEALQATADALSTGSSARLVDAARGAVLGLLRGRVCDWAPGFHGRIGAVLRRDGSLSGSQGSLLPDGWVEIPVVHRNAELGRLVVRTDASAPVSAEERITAVTVADMLAAGLSLLDPGDAHGERR